MSYDQKGSFTIDFILQRSSNGSLRWPSLKKSASKNKEAGEIVKLDQHLQAWIWAAFFCFLESHGPFCQLSNEKGAPGCLGYIGNCTGDDATQLCGDYNGLNNQYNGK